MDIVSMPHAITPLSALGAEETVRALLPGQDGPAGRYLSRYGVRLPAPGPASLKSARRQAAQYKKAGSAAAVRIRPGKSSATQVQHVKRLYL